MKKFYITTPIYYVNAEPHLGHTYATVSADVIARYYRLKLGKENVFFLTGTDEHGSKIKEKADQEGKKPKVFCDEVSDLFKNVWKQFEITNNKFIRTTDKEHISFVIDFIQKLKDNDALYEDYYEGLYCVGCEKFITEKELVDGKCPDHLIEPEIVKEKNWFFNLKKYLPQIQKLIQTDELIIMPEKSKKEVLGLIKQGVPNFSVSREKNKVQWGIELPWDSSQLIYVWCDALTNYVSAVDGKDWWPADLHVIGRDIVKFHALYWPAMLIAAGYELPKSEFVHGYFTVNGTKMSKTLGNVIDPLEMFKEYGLDATKYLILSQFPFGQDGDIEANKFIEKYNSDLSNGLGNLFNRVLSLVEKNCENKIPEKSNIKELESLISNTWKSYSKNMEETRRIDIILTEIWKVIHESDRIISEIKLWELVKSDSQKANEYLYSFLEVLRHISWMIIPYMQKTAQEMQKQLGNIEFEKKKTLDGAKEWGGLEPGIRLQKGNVLFMRK